MKKLFAALICIPMVACVPATMMMPKEKTPVSMPPKSSTPEQKALTWAITLCSKFGYAKNTAEFRLCAETRYDQFLMENR